ncbi:DnaJ family domain-containing protein [Paracoccus aminophilus]|uniref:DnaJ homologue subfamily C member 28 conserved domain-containing protein n=1 Tax=Paracoccus aminophilus JCM 7686 TaxID=1367847 RepID=S5XLS3_PARAH|nr:DUF1992 domain-containing protein [Paracoccus aminophilus]AGT08184.1 hypothetical protein JCM7686_1075 [Paracoccus aminophilus JCM 7686]
MGWLDRIAERLMLKARAEGKLSGLAGEGKPLPAHPEEAMIDTGTALGYRIMAEAGVLPTEIVIKKEIDALRLALADLPEGEDRRAALARLADLEMRHAMAQEARRAFMR